MKRMFLMVAMLLVLMYGFSISMMRVTDCSTAMCASRGTTTPARSAYFERFVATSTPVQLQSVVHLVASPVSPMPTWTPVGDQGISCSNGCPATKPPYVFPNTYTPAP